MSEEKLKKLEDELRDALGNGDFPEGLDIIEEIEELGPLKARHLTVRGQCLIKMRRKQDAKVALLAAFELDPSFDAAVKLLDQNFPGWTRTPKAPPKPMPAAPPPMPSMTQTQPAYAPPPGAGAPGGYQGPPAAGGGGSQPSFGYATQGAGAPRGPAGPPGFGGAPGGYAPPAQEMPLNWNYVMQDLEEAKIQAGVAEG